MKVQKIICDECGVERKDSNHWFMSHVAADGRLVIEGIREEEDVVSHLCGQACVHKVVDRWMTEG